MLIAIAYEALKLFRDKITDSKLKKKKTVCAFLKFNFHFKTSF